MQILWPLVPATITLVSIFVGLYQYSDTRRGKIRIFTSIPHERVKDFGDAFEPHDHISVRIVNVTDKVRLISNIYFSYRGNLAKLNLHKIISFPIELLPMKQYEVIIPFKLFIEQRKHIESLDQPINDKPLDIEHILGIYARDTSGKLYKTKTIVTWIDNRAFTSTDIRGSLYHRISLNAGFFLHSKNAFAKIFKWFLN